MSARISVGCAVLVVALGAAGCVVPCHKGYQKSLEHGAEYELPTPCRNRVHVFMMHGVTPSMDCGLNTLRLRLGDNGFAMVGIGELCHLWWVKNEIECIRKNDPDARFVLLGYDYGAAVACLLARDLKEKGAPIDAVVLLNPKGVGHEPCGVDTLLIVDGKSTACVPHSARVVVPDATHFSLPAHPTTVAVVTDLLQNVAARYCETAVEEVPVWSYPHAPAAHPMTPVRGLGAEWDFLADRPGSPRPIGTQVTAHPATKPPATAAVPPNPVAAKH